MAPNRLVREKSPYLQQHAYNPVDWYPWGEEAFAAAKELQKPVFLSIGYATCHWCHVMEQESFQNGYIAGLMNEAFINVKVDREELPEVDSMYMEFAQALMSTGGGWPLNVILTPDLKPFFASTYLPPINRRGLIGMPEFIQSVKKMWESEERELVIEQAQHLVDLFTRSSHSTGETLPTELELIRAVEQIYQLFDPVYGGFKGEPKFPMSYGAQFLLAFSKLRGDSRALFCVQTTLEKMRCGGIYDQLGGGFSRYAVDEAWQVPHFEKMLYDNALLIAAYADAYRYTRQEMFGDVVRQTIGYVKRELAHPEGGFYSAEDADSEGQEGLYYTWTVQEIVEVLGREGGERFCEFYGIEDPGTFEGRNVLSIESLEGEKEFQEAREALFKRRQMRVHPFKDDKILTGWNGLMIDALVRCGALDEAVRAAKFLKEHLWVSGKLLRRFREGEARFTGGADDYAFVIKGALSLFEAGCGTQWLAWAIELAEVMEREFKTENGAFYSIAEQGSLLLRRCEFYDGGEPSSNAVHAENLLRLHQITFESRFLTQAEDILKAIAPYLETVPMGACYHLIAVQRYLDKNAETVVVALDEEAGLEKMIRTTLEGVYHPHRVVIWKRANDPLIDRLAPSHADKKAIDGQTAIYICRHDRCGSPLVAAAEILKALQT